MNNKNKFSWYRGNGTDFKMHMHALISRYGKIRSLEVLTMDPRPDRRLLVIFDRECDALVAAQALGGTRLGLSGIKLTI